MRCVLVHYGEIGTKGKNRKMFEKQLIENISYALKKLDWEGKIKLWDKRIIIYDVRQEQAEILSKIFGIENFAFASIVDGGKECWKEHVLKNFPFSDYFVVKARRVDKSLPFTSMDFNKELGALITQHYDVKVDLKNKNNVVYVEILNKNRAIIYFKKEKGPGGLPIGCGGKGIVLLSGGIDSPVAAWRMMQRGMKQIFLHIRPFKIFNKENKVYRIVKELQKWHQLPTKLYTITCHHFSNQKDKIDRRYAAVLFRVFVHKIADILSKKERCDAIINGDALAQVASQTPKNIFLIDNFISTPIIRPLISFPKKEIIDWAGKIGTYKLSIEPYKDCCAMLVSMPTTTGKLERVKELVNLLNLDECAEKTVAELECYEFD